MNDRAPANVTPYGAIAYRLDALAGKLSVAGMENQFDELWSIIDDLVALNMKGERTSDTIDLHLGEAPENFEPDCTDPRWILTVTCGDQMNVTTFSKRLVAAFPEVVQWLSDKAVHRIRDDVATAALRAENEELKQWASDACELLHELRNIADGESYHACVADTDALLRRMENP